MYPPTHPYFGNVIGSMQDLQAASLDDVRQFFVHYYAPANATLVVVGDFNTAKIKKLINKYFGSLPRRAKPDTVPVALPTIDGEKRETVREPVTLSQIAMGWISPVAFTEDDAACDMLSIILGVGKSSRLYKKLVYELQIAQDVSAHQESLQLGSMFQVTIQSRPGVDMQRLENELQDVLDAIKIAPPSEDEVERARNVILTQMASQIQMVGGFGGKADLLNRYNHYVGDPGYLPKDIARYRAVSASDIQKIAQKLLTRNRAVVWTVPVNPS
jgi:zinc protease